VDVKTASNPTQAAATGGEPATFPDLIDRTVRGHGERVFLPRRRARVVEPVTFRRLCSDVDLVAAGLVALGVQHGDRVGLLAENRYEWLLADLGITYCGAVDVPRGSDTSPAEMVFILRHSGCRAAIVEDDKTATAVLQRRSDLPELQQVITLQSGTAVTGVLTLGEVMERGRRLLAAEPGRVRARAEAVRGDDLLTIVYTSGTTAEPKGVMLTHRNVMSNIHAVKGVLHITRSDTFLSVLPAWHMYERIMDYLALEAGGQLVYTDRRHIKEDLQQVAPTVFAAVPRIWETIHDGLTSYALKKPGLRGKLLRATLDLCRTVGGRRANFPQRCLHALLRATVLPRLLAITGGRLRLPVSGGGALPRHVDETLLGIGLPILNGYGLTETSPVAAVREPERNGPGTIGPPIPGTEIRARDGEGRWLGPGQTGVLWIRGPQVMRGYYQNPARTATVLDQDGWFDSGDLGHVDDDGKVWITGRAKDTIVLASGENVEPEPIEAAIKRSPLIEQVVCVGQDQKVIGALIVPAFELLEREVPRAQWDVREGCMHGKAVHALVRRELDRLVQRDTGFRPCDRVAAFEVLTEPLTTENGCLTQTLKVRRHVVQERYGRLITALFG
jgi:long-chain acyl-CoA synthetase